MTNLQTFMAAHMGEAITYIIPVAFAAGVIAIVVLVTGLVRRGKEKRVEREDREKDRKYSWAAMEHEDKQQESA